VLAPEQPQARLEGLPEFAKWLLKKPRLAELNEPMVETLMAPQVASASLFAKGPVLVDVSRSIIVRRTAGIGA